MGSNIKKKKKNTLQDQREDVYWTNVRFCFLSFSQSRLKYKKGFLATILFKSYKPLPLVCYQYLAHKVIRVVNESSIFGGERIEFWARWKISQSALLQIRERTVESTHSPCLCSAPHLCSVGHRNPFLCY